MYRHVCLCTTLLLVLLACTSTSAKEVVLLDTTSESSLDWIRYPYGPQSSTPGWVEESFTNFEKGINWRSYVVCDVAYNNVNNWLWTPFIERRDTNRIYIEVKFSMRDCNLFPGMALSCKETFSLLYYEFDSANKEPPPWEPESYKLIDRIAADEGRFTFNSDVIINTEIRSIPVTKKGVYFAFRDQGACLSLIAIKIYYLVCPNIIANFAYFPETPTGKELTSIVHAEGQCVANARQIEKPQSLCHSDGNWILPTGGCKCMAGFEPIGQSCQVCPPGTFKPVTGDELCGPCPLHSIAPYRGSTECRCDAGYYRASNDPKWAPCTQPPSAPQNLKVNLVDQSSVILTWSEPLYLGGRNDTVYRVTCEPCTLAVAFSPARSGLTDTKVAVSGLNPTTTYRFQVFAENGVSNFDDSSQYVDISVTTEASEFTSYASTRNHSPEDTDDSSVAASPLVYVIVVAVIALILAAAGTVAGLMVRQRRRNNLKRTMMQHTIPSSFSTRTSLKLGNNAIQTAKHSSTPSKKPKQSDVEESRILDSYLWVLSDRQTPIYQTPDRRSFRSVQSNHHNQHDYHHYYHL